MNEEVKKIINYRKSNDLINSQILINDLLKLYPNNSNVLFEQALLYKVKKQYDEALSILYKLAKTNIRNIALMEIGNIYSKLNKLYRANGIYLTLYEESKDKMDSPLSYKDKVFPLQRLITNSRKNGLRADAYNYLNILIDILNTSNYSTTQDKLNAINEAALLNFLDGNINEALKNYFEIFEKGNNNDYQIVLSEMATIYLNNHQTDVARNLLNQIENPKYSLRNDFLLGRLEFMEQNFDKAIQIFNSQLNTSNHRAALDKLICLYFKTCNNKKAEEYIYQIIKLFNKNDSRVNRYYSILNIINLKKEDALKEYMLNAAINKIIKKYNSNNSININIPIEQLIKTIKLDKENYYDSDKYDNYIVCIPNIGSIKDSSTDFVKVTTLINTNNIAGIYPCRNLNNQLHHEDLIVYKRTIEK